MKKIFLLIQLPDNGVEFQGKPIYSVDDVPTYKRLLRDNSLTVLTDSEIDFFDCEQITVAEIYGKRNYDTQIVYPQNRFIIDATTAWEKHVCENGDEIIYRCVTYKRSNASTFIDPA
jgi:hypothetical protein